MAAGIRSGMLTLPPHHRHNHLLFFRRTDVCAHCMGRFQGLGPQWHAHRRPADQEQGRAGHLRRHGVLFLRSQQCVAGMAPPLPLRPRLSRIVSRVQDLTQSFFSPSGAKPFCKSVGEQRVCRRVYHGKPDPPHGALPPSTSWAPRQWRPSFRVPSSTPSLTHFLVLRPQSTCAPAALQPCASRRVPCLSTSTAAGERASRTLTLPWYGRMGAGPGRREPMGWLLTLLPLRHQEKEKAVWTKLMREAKV